MPCSCGKGVNCKCIKKKPSKKNTFDQTSTVCGVCKLPTTANVLTGKESGENMQGETCTCCMAAVGFSSEAVGQSTVASAPNVDPQTSAAGEPDKQSEKDSWERKETDSSDLYAQSSTELNSISENKSDNENINAYISIIAAGDQFAELANNDASANPLREESVNNSRRENEFDNSRALNTENQENVNVQNFMSQEQLPDRNQQTGLASNANVVNYLHPRNRNPHSQHPPVVPHPVFLNPMPIVPPFGARLIPRDSHRKRQSLFYPSQNILSNSLLREGHPALAASSTVESKRKQSREKVAEWIETIQEPESNFDVIQPVSDDEDVEQPQARGPSLSRRLSLSSTTDESASNPRPEEQRRRPRRKMAKKDDGKFSEKK